mmetsp:Transcript_16316/g.37500  ORF Transcript_16316/g.37500 Transcript_16316/m.37500 type:complete len:111 (+) Transcript_16316:413-745(+)
MSASPLIVPWGVAGWTRTSKEEAQKDDWAYSWGGYVGLNPSKLTTSFSHPPDMRNNTECGNAKRRVARTCRTGAYLWATVVPQKVSPGPWLEKRESHGSGCIGIYFEAQK